MANGDWAVTDQNTGYVVIFAICTLAGCPDHDAVAVLKINFQTGQIMSTENLAVDYNRQVAFGFNLLPNPSGPIKLRWQYYTVENEHTYYHDIINSLEDSLFTIDVTDRFRWSNN